MQVVFELGGSNVPERTMNNMQKLINITKQNDKRKENFKYKRLRSYRYNLDSDCENVSDIVKEAINNILSWEREVLQLVSKDK